MATGTTADPNDSGTPSGRRDWLVRRRKSLGLTQEDLAARLKVDRSTVARWERGETEPQPWLRPRLASALGITTERLGALLGAGNAGGQAPGSGAGHAAALGTEPTVPRQLPATIADFTGRAAELATLAELIDTSGAVPGTVVISAIGGTPGVGKTALALHWAQQVADRFGGGQLYVNLRGFDPSGSPARPADAVRGFLDALGVLPTRIPADADAQAGLYRSLLSGKRMLIVLDNARDEQQVRPLLPAGPDSLVIVTSRNELAGLAAAEGARLLTLDVLSQAEAIELFTARVGRSRAAAEPEATAEIALLCGCLPLAIAVAAARTAFQPGRSLAAFAAELRDAAGAPRLDALDTGDPAASVRAVFSWSYQELSTGAARMFRLLGLHPGPDISVPAVASLTAVGRPEAGRVLRELTRAHLVVKRTPGRYGLHDLLRAYAAEQAGSQESGPDREAAVARLLDHYLHTSHAAAFLVHPSRDPIAVAPRRPGVVPEPLPERLQATRWLEAEHQTLLAVITLAANAGFGSHAWQIPWALADYLDRRGLRDQKATLQGIALAAATRLADIAGQAVSLRILANSRCDLGDYDQARRHLERSLALYRELGDKTGEARTQGAFANLAERQARYADALGHDGEALRLYQVIGNDEGEAIMLNNLAWCHGHLGNYEEARALGEQALTRYGAVPANRHLASNVWDTLGYIEYQLGNFDEAVTCYERAGSVAREFGDRPQEAENLTHLGDTHYAAGRLTQAREAWQRALAILNVTDDPVTDELRAKLHGLGD